MTDVFLDPKVMNYTGDKYELILLSLRWGKILKSKGTPEPLPHLVEKALRDIVEGKVSKDEIMSTAPAVEPEPADELPAAVSVADDGSEPKPLPPDEEEDKKVKKAKKKKDE